MVADAEGPSANASQSVAREPGLRSCILILESQRNSKLPHTAGNLLHGWLFSAVSEHNPSLAAELHASSRHQVFALSEPLDPHTRAMARLSHSGSQDRTWPVRRSEVLTVRISAVDGRLSSLLAELFVAAAAGQLTLRLKSSPFQLIDADVDGVHDREAGCTSWSSIAGRYSLIPDDRLPRAVSLKFRTPTVFTRKGWESGTTKNGREAPTRMLFPEPTAFISSMNARLRRVQGRSVIDTASARANLDEQPPERFESIMVAQYDLRTELQIYPAPAGPCPGFLGTVRYDLSRTPAPMIREFLSLIEFSFYAGVGYKAAMGMGSMAPPSYG